MGANALLCDLSVAPVLSLATTRDGGRPENIRRYECASRDAFDDAVRDYIKDVCGAPAAVAIAARGWQQREKLHLDGVGFDLNRGDIRTLAGVLRISFVNNFVARALAVPRLARTDRQPIVDADIADDSVIAVLGPHYGLGLATLVSKGDGGWTALNGEGGHSDLPVRTEREWRLVEAIRARTGYVCREDGLSVAGLGEIWTALHVIAGDTPPPMTADEIVLAARGGHPRAVETLEIMTLWLADLASDVALILGATGGVYLTGALMDMTGDLFDADTFRTRYLDKGPRAEYVRGVPVFRTAAVDMELAGLATLFE